MESRNEKLFDALLKVAGDEALKRKMDALPSREELDEMYPHTPSLDKRVMRIIKKKLNIGRVKRAAKAGVRIAACWGVILTLGGVILMSVEASRNFILNAIIDFQKENVIVEFNGSDDDAPNAYVLGYLPDGFSLISSQDTGSMSTLIYQHHDGFRLIFQTMNAEATSASFDNENATFSFVTINQQEGYFIASTDDNDYNTLMWQSDGDVLKLISDLSEDELITIAEGIRKK